MQDNYEHRLALRWIDAVASASGREVAARRVVQEKQLLGAWCRSMWPRHRHGPSANEMWRAANLNHRGPALDNDPRSHAATFVDETRREIARIEFVKFEGQMLLELIDREPDPFWADDHDAARPNDGRMQMEPET